jgi:anti-sigma regulatory factor (Ser/Thr protein kinase)
MTTSTDAPFFRGVRNVNGIESDDMVKVTLAGDPRAAGHARDALRHLPLELDEPVQGNMRLLVTELITNSVRHGKATDVRLMVKAAPHTVRIEVADTGPGFQPGRRREPSTREGGWGLYLVERLSDRWGVMSVNGATQVWCELDR